MGPIEPAATRVRRGRRAVPNILCSVPISSQSQQEGRPAGAAHHDRARCRHLPQRSNQHHRKQRDDRRGDGGGSLRDALLSRAATSG
jgi:hypothetical protein